MLDPGVRVSFDRFVQQDELTMRCLCIDLIPTA